MATAKNTELSPDVVELIEDYQRSAPEPLPARERVVELCLALPVVAVGIAMAVGFTATRSFSMWTTVAFLIAFLLAKRIQFAVGAGYTIPTQLVFVPMLFLLPTPLVPLLVVAASTLTVVPELIAGKKHIDRLLIGPTDAAYAIAPTLVLLVAGVQTAGWSHWWIYAAALAAQIVGEVLFSTAHEWLILRVPPRLQPQLLDLVIVIDVLLTPIGFMAALVGTEHSGGWLLVLPLLGLIAVFARERQARIEHAVELGRAYRGTTLLLSDVLEADDEYTGSHSWGVVTLALRVADAMGLDAHERRNVEFGALLHDIGKIAVPKEIINKPGKLNDEEWLVIKTHTVEGERMLNRVGGVLGEVGRIVRSSHERWDGNGYPDGLKGDEIPVEACIVACCDAFDAMTTTRSYRDAMPLAKALAEIQANAGTQFSPHVARVVVELLQHEAETASAHVGARVQLSPAPGTP
ncbi:MAG TPA: HD-GYP domain-containing protein [Thermoleophilaceae bacterium]|jgi:putative nucleotidyltransferase with HDIG domain